MQSSRPDWCPIKGEIPYYHNRLIDEKDVMLAFSDAILEDAQDTGNVRATWNEVYNVIKSVATIVKENYE